LSKFQDILSTDSFMVKLDEIALQEFLLYIFTKLGVDPQQTPIILTLPIKASQEFSEILQRLLFTFFNVPKVYFIPSVFCVLYAFDTNTGVVVSLGDRHTVVQSILKGIGDEAGFMESDITGARITEILGNLVANSQENVLLTPNEMQGVKEQVALFVRDSDEALKTVEECPDKFKMEVPLPDGTNFILITERFLAVEPYFQPKQVNSSSLSLTKLIEDAIKQWGLIVQPELGAKIYLAGGGTLVPNLKERLEFEMKKVFPKMQLNIIASDNREHLEWTGASALYKRSGNSIKWVQNPNWENSQEEKTGLSEQ